jgi:hypothetical protein
MFDISSPMNVIFILIERFILNVCNDQVSGVFRVF